MLPNNLIDRDFRMMLLPLNILEFVYCQPKYQIAGAFVNPNGVSGKLHCLLGVLIIIITNVINTEIMSFVHGDPLSKSIFELGFTDGVFYSVSGVFVCVTIIVQDTKHVQLVLKMQNAYRTLKDDGGLKRFQRSNVMFIATFFLSYLLYNLCYTFFNIYNVTHLVYNTILFYFDVNIIVSSRIVTFLEYEVILWKNELTRFQKTCSETNHEQLIKYLTNIGLEEKKLFRAYKNIIGAFKLCSSIFGTSMIVMMLEAFGHPLIYIQFFIDVSKGHNAGVDTPLVSKLILLVSLIWIVKTFILMSYLCIVCQRFYLAVIDVEVASAVIRSEGGCLVHARRLSKNVSRLGASVSARRAMRAGRLVSVDATTPLQLLTLLGTYTIVLLQFAFL